MYETVDRADVGVVGDLLLGSFPPADAGATGGRRAARAWPRCRIRRPWVVGAPAGGGLARPPDEGTRTIGADRLHITREADASCRESWAIGGRGARVGNLMTHQYPRADCAVTRR